MAAAPGEVVQQATRVAVTLGSAEPPVAAGETGEGGAGGQGAVIEGSYGDLVPRNGVISLPESFLYIPFAAAGTMMSDGMAMPGAHDGMACFAGKGSHVILLRNHELSASEEASGDAKLYDALGAAA